MMHEKMPFENRPLSVLDFTGTLLIVGSAPLSPDVFQTARQLAPHMIAADGGANHLEQLGVIPNAIIGDLDSLHSPKIWKSKTKLIQVQEQDSTDFEKCLRLTRAPLTLAIGFTGGRLDHSLAALHALLYFSPRPIVMFDAEQLIFALPLSLRIEGKIGQFFSLFPLISTKIIHSTGLFWPLDGLTLCPGLMIGTSNKVVSNHIKITCENVGTLIIMPKCNLGSIVSALKCQ